MAFESGIPNAALLAALLSVLAVWAKRALFPKKAAPKSFQEDLRDVDGFEDIEAFCERWRGRAPAGRPKVRPEDVLAEGILSPEQIIPWPAHVQEPCWIEWKRDGDERVWRAASGRNGTLSNAGHKVHLYWRLVRITKNPL